MLGYGYLKYTLALEVPHPEVPGARCAVLAGGEHPLCRFLEPNAHHIFGDAFVVDHWSSCGRPMDVEHANMLVARRCQHLAVRRDLQGVDLKKNILFLRA